MLPRFSTSKSLRLVLLLTVLLTNPATAHKVETGQDVGATLHIEPDDNPRAGKSALTWFALTQKGGQIIPLQQCNCKLAIYSQTARSSVPLLQPPLKAISAEQYQGVPSAEITFPTAGAYELKLSGTPQAGANFKPFELSYQVTVAPGAVKREITIQPQQSQNRWLLPVIAIATILGLGIFGVVWRKLKT